MNQLQKIKKKLMTLSLCVIIALPLKVLHAKEYSVVLTRILSLGSNNQSVCDED